MKKKFDIIRSTCVPLPLENVDTDQIIPARFLKATDRRGFGQHLFHDWRFNADGSPRPFVLNDPRYGGEILLAGKNFGCGSSREHAVWGLMQMGIRAVIASGFGEIFYSNCFNNGLLACRVSPEDAAAIMAALSDTTPVELTVDLVAQEIRAGDGVWSFEVAPRHRTMLMEGLDMIAATLRDMDEIERFRAVHEAEFPWMTGLAGKAKRRLEGR